MAASIIMLCAARADAQSPGVDETSGNAALAQNLLTAPAAGKWQASLNFTFQFQGGRTESLSYDVDLVVAHATKRIALFRVDAEVRRSEYVATPGAPRTTSDDNQTFCLTTIPRVKGRISAIAIASLRVDRPVGLDHRAMLQAGPYLLLATSKRLSLAFAPLFGVGQQDNALQGGPDGITSFGAMQALTWQPTKTATIEIFGAAHRNTALARDRAVLVNTSISATMSKYVSLSLSHTYSLEGVHPVGVSAVQNTVGAGIRLFLPS